MRNYFRIFKLKPEERLPGLVALVFFLLLNAMPIIKYNTQFVKVTDNFRHYFLAHFHLSGFDPLTYSVISSWQVEYNCYRHPLLAFFMYPLYLVNHALMALTGLNLAQWVVAALLVFCAFYSFIFLRRIFRELIGVTPIDANLLSAYYFSFAYVMVTVLAPDHFCLSMMLLLLTIYISGLLMQKGKQLTIVQTVLLFVFTAGVSLNNGLKTYMAALWVNKRKFFSPKFLLLAVVVPCALIWLFARWEYHVFVWPREMARKEMKAKVRKAKKDKMTAMYMQKAAELGVEDSARQAAYADSVMASKKAKDKQARKKNSMAKRQGKPLMNGEFMGWTDVTTPRLPSLVHNVFGEGIQLHDDYLLKDELAGRRPMFVNYRWAWNYVMEALVVVLFLAGCWFARRSRLFWLVASFAALDIFLHLVLGFGINEIYIMSAHWIYLLPIATAFLFVKAKGKMLLALRGLTLLLTVAIGGWNIWLLLGFFLP
jgi:hypothetical protein